jgi:pre-mRNA-splicing factor CWC22
LFPAFSDDVLNVFKHDPEFEANEEKYDSVKKQLLGEESGSGSSSSEGSDEDESGSGSESENEDTSAPIIDHTETNLIALRRVIYLTIQVSCYVIR